MSPTARGWTGLVVLVAAVAIAPLAAPHDPSRQFSSYPYAPPMRLHLHAADGSWHLPFAHPLRVEDPLDRRYGEDVSVRIPLDSEEPPVFLLGSDGLGRDVLSRLLAGARLSLGVALASTLVSLLIAVCVGAVSGYAGGWMDAALMRVAEFVLVLPAIYVALALRGALPLVLTDAQVFAALVFVFGCAGWPAAARGVRGIITTEKHQEYAEAAKAIGASPWRILARHLLPAAAGFLIVQAVMLVPAFVMAEATLSFVGFGFLPPAASWGTMLADVTSPQTTAAAPWLLAPAGAVVLTILFVHALAGSQAAAYGWGQNSK